MSLLADATALVTGGASGLGRAVARRIVAEGGAVVIADIDADGAEATAAELGEQALAVTADVSREADVARAVAATTEWRGGLDLLVNNAALLDQSVFGRDGGIVDMAVDVWDATLAVNLRGAMLGCKHAIPAMIASGGGAIVNVASISGLIGEDDHVAYASSKAALFALTRHVASMHGADGIRCNAVAPGLMLTDNARALLSDADLAVFRAERLLDEPSTPDDVANVVVFLLSSEAGAITGQTHVVDRGVLAHRPRHAFRRLSQ